MKDIEPEMRSIIRHLCIPPAMRVAAACSLSTFLRSMGEHTASATVGLLGLTRVHMLPSGFVL